MLTRHHIRIKVLQSLYAFSQNGSTDGKKALKDLKQSLDNIYRLYLLDLYILRLLVSFLEERLEIERSKQLPQHGLILVLEKAIQDKFLRRLAEDAELIATLEKYRVHFGDAKDFIRSILFAYWNSDLAQLHFTAESPLPAGWVKQFYAAHVAYNTELHALYENMELHWADDLDSAQMMVVKTMKNINQDKPLLVSLYKDIEDASFGGELLVKTLKERPEWEKAMAEKAKNWDIERMAVIDRLLVEMALTELVSFPEVPAKVTINECIDLAKEYSTPKSSAFVNGLIDSIQMDLQKAGRIHKWGKGLL